MMCFFPVAVASSFRDVDDRRSTEERVLAKEAYAGALTNSKPKNETCPGRVFGGEARQTDFSVAIIDRADNISYFGIATVGGLSGLAEMAKTQGKKHEKKTHTSSIIVDRMGVASKNQNPSFRRSSSKGTRFSGTS
jgi:hypothetical protein